MTKEYGTKVEAVDAAVVENLGKRLIAWSCVAFAFSMLFAIVSLRCLYADGSFYLMRVLEAGNFVTFPEGRYFATFMFELPVVAAIKLGITNLHILQLAFGLGCFMPWPLALTLCHKIAPRHFWLALLACAVGYINTGFMPVSECNVAHAFFWPVLFSILFARPLNPASATILIASATILLFSYESLLFLGPPVALLAGWRAVKGQEKYWARAVLGCAAILLVAAAAIAFKGILHPASATNLGGFKYGIMQIAHSPTWSMLWTLVWLALGLIVCVSGKGFTKKRFGLEKALFAAVMVIWALGPFLHPADTGADRGYELRSLQLIVPFALILPALLLAVYPQRFETRYNYLLCFSGSLLLAQSLWLISVTWQWNGFVGMWRGVLASHRGPVALADTPFTVPSSDGQALSFEWTWANPTLSIMLSPQNNVKSVILSGSIPPWQPFDPLNGQDLPKLQRYGINYDDYLKSLPIKEAPHKL